MNFKMFQDALAEEIRQQSGGKVQAVCQHLTKNNGVVREALEIRAPGERISPSIYLESFYQQYLKGVSIAHLARLMLAQYREFQEKARLPEDFFGDYEKASEGIFCKLINCEKNRTLLCEIPHELWMDLAIVCYYRVDQGFLEEATILIRNEHLKRWNITPDELKERAWKNTLEKRPPQLQKLSSLLRQWGVLEHEEQDVLEESPLYLLTNSGKCLGAICIRYPGEAEKIGERLGSDYYVLPSSIHECLILPAGDRYSAGELQDMVREINSTQLQPQEILSDHVYYYDRSSRRLSQCADSRAR